ncbi:hypothetical protein MZM54_32795 [[Brevibacterium] frigoritolerans]|nr:hypothetical protein [Peribacillus frigoritolerans]
MFPICTMLSGRIENFKEYSQFDSLKDFNTTIEMFLADHKKDFTKGELVAFKRLVRYSAKFFGVAHAKIGTIVKAINEKLNGFGISRRTFERMINKAESLGILVRKHTVKVKGGQGHNVYIFQPFDTIVAPKTEKLSHRQNDETSTESKDERNNSQGETINLSESSKTKRLSKRIEGTVSLNHSFVSDYVPKEFTDLVWLNTSLMTLKPLKNTGEWLNLIRITFSTYWTKTRFYIQLYTHLSKWYAS